MTTGDLHARLAGVSPGNACKVCAFLSTISAVAAQEWQDELRFPVAVVGNTAVVNELRRLKVDVTEAAVRRHRSRHVPR